MRAHLESLIASYLLHGELGIGLLQNLIQLASERPHPYHTVHNSSIPHFNLQHPTQTEWHEYAWITVSSQTKKLLQNTSNTFSVSSGIVLSWLTHADLLCTGRQYPSSAEPIRRRIRRRFTSAVKWILSDSHGWPWCVHGNFRPGQKCNVVAGSRSNRFIGMLPAHCSAGSLEIRKGCKWHRPRKIKKI